MNTSIKTYEEQIDQKKVALSLYLHYEEIEDYPMRYELKNKRFDSRPKSEEYGDYIDHMKIFNANDIDTIFFENFVSDGFNDYSKNREDENYYQNDDLYTYLCYYYDIFDSADIYNLSYYEYQDSNVSGITYTIVTEQEAKYLINEFVDDMYEKFKDIQINTEEDSYKTLKNHEFSILTMMRT